MGNLHISVILVTSLKYFDNTTLKNGVPTSANIFVDMVGVVLIVVSRVDYT